MPRRTARTGIVVLLLAAALVPVRAAQRTLVQLPQLPGGVGTSAIAINDHGEIAGTAGTASGSPHAVLWSHGAVMDLGILPISTQSSALSINNRGQVVGYGDSPTGQHAILWDHGAIIDLGPLEPGGSGLARHINNRGQVVGEGEDAVFGSTHAVVWQNSAVIDLGQGVAFTNNDRGEVVGLLTFDGAFVWRNGRTRLLGTLPGGGFSAANDINQRGQIVGWADVNNTSHGFIWDRGVMTDLGALPGGVGSVANAINDRGQVVGSAGTATGEGHAFLWENGTMIDLGMLPGSTSSEAIAINNRGQIAGWSHSPSGSEIFLWEKGTIIDLGIGSNPLPNLSLHILNAHGEVVGGSAQGAAVSTERPNREDER